MRFRRLVCDEEGLQVRGQLVEEGNALGVLRFFEFGSVAARDFPGTPFCLRILMTLVMVALLLVVERPAPADKPEAAKKVLRVAREPDMPSAGYLESLTLGTMDRRLGRLGGGARGGAIGIARV